MKKKINRREFFKSLPFFPSLIKEEVNNRDTEKTEKSEKKIPLIRPPYSYGSDFSLCKDCEGKCIDICEEGILKRFKDKSPYIVFNLKGCSFCEKCVDVCDLGVLSKDKPAKIYMDISINPNKCMAWHGVMCFSCKDPCIDNAIKFEGLFKPKIDLSLCSGCGFCINVCPSGAIEINPLN